MKTWKMGLFQTILAVSVLMDFCSADSGENGAPCSSLSYAKVSLNQTEGQYVEYVANVPDISSFTLHYWVQILEPKPLMPSFSYLGEGSKGKEYVQVTLLKTGDSWFALLQVKGVVVSNAKLPEDFQGPWHHLLHSWDGDSGIWSIYLDGELLEEGVSPKSQGIVVKGGGRVFTGQQASSIINSSGTSCSDISKYDEGISGWVTLLGLDTRAITRPKYWINRMAVSVVATGCHVDHKGDIISWMDTPRKGYCGATEARANSVCGKF